MRAGLRFPGLLPQSGRHRLTTKVSARWRTPISQPRRWNGWPGNPWTANDANSLPSTESSEVVSARASGTSRFRDIGLWLHKAARNWMRSERFMPVRSPTLSTAVLSPSNCSARCSKSQSTAPARRSGPSLGPQHLVQHIVGIRPRERQQVSGPVRLAPLQPAAGQRQSCQHAVAGVAAYHSDILGLLQNAFGFALPALPVERGRRRTALAGRTPRESDRRSAWLRKSIYVISFVVPGAGVRFNTSARPSVFKSCRS